MFILEFLNDLITYQSPGIGDVYYAIPPWVAIAAGILGGIQKKKRGEKLMEEAEAQAAAARENLPDDSPQYLKDYISNQKALIERSYDVGSQTQSNALQAVMENMKRNNP